MTVKLEVDNLSSGYGRIPIVHGVSLAVRAGEAVGVLGNNGMGKTTLLRTIAGHLRPTAGRVWIDGSELTRASPAMRASSGLGYVPQGRQIFSSLSVRDNLRMGAAAKGLDDRVLDDVLDELPRLKPILERPGGVLSGGEQQILALGRCLCGQPSIILLDEPTEGIQPSIVQEMIEVLGELKRKRALTILLVEQNINFIRRLSDRVLVIEKGSIKAELAANDLQDTDRVSMVMGMSVD